MKKKLIATAVAGVFAAPAAMADEHVSVDPYFRIANALDWTDTDGADSTTDLRNVSSRIGIRGSADLGNGMTVFGQYEFSTFTDREGQDGGRGGINDTRIGIVGIEGSFGTISAGNQWSAFYNTAGVHLDPTYTLGYVVYSSQMGGPYRQSNAVKYANSFGPVYLEIDTRFSTDSPATGQDVEKIGGDNGEDFLDGAGIGASFAATDMLSFAAAYDVERADPGEDQERLGLGVRADLGSFWASVAYMTNERDASGLAPEIDQELWGAFIGAPVGENTQLMAGYLSGEDNVTGTEPNQVLMHANHKIGGGPLRLFYEGTLFDGDGGRADFDTHLLGMRIDF